MKGIHLHPHSTNLNSALIAIRSKERKFHDLTVRRSEKYRELVKNHNNKRETETISIFMKGAGAGEDIVRDDRMQHRHS